jgi:hypothetical protein
MISLFRLGPHDAPIIDVFSSDSIPMPLLTREAPALYLRKLAPGGRLLFHDSREAAMTTPGNEIIRRLPDWPVVERASHSLMEPA